MSKQPSPCSFLAFLCLCITCCLFSSSTIEAVGYMRRSDPQFYSQNVMSQWTTASRLIMRCKLRGNERVLELGSGDGRVGASLAAQVPNGRVVGIEMNPELVYFSQRSYTPNCFNNLQFMTGEFDDIRYKEEFDFVFAVNTMHWMSDHSKVLRAVWKALKPEGKYVMTIPAALPKALQESIDEVIKNPSWSKYFDNYKPCWNFTTGRNYAKLLDINGFEVRRIEMVSQKDYYQTRQAMQDGLYQWLVYLDVVPTGLQHHFLTAVMDRYVEKCPPNAQGHFTMEIERLEIEASKDSCHRTIEPMQELQNFFGD